MSPSRPVLAVVPLALAALLSGCSGAVTAGSGTGAGVAVRVGDDSVRLVEVDRATDGVCRAITPEITQNGQAYALGDLRRYVVRALASRLQLEQWADERGVTAGATYGNRRAELETVAETLPAEVRDDYVRAESAQAFTQDLLVQVGTATLQAQGTPAPTPEAAFEAGAVDFQQWAAEQPDAEIDPRFGLAMREGSFVLEETGSSVAVSDAATQGSAEQLDPTYVASLPENQRCGG